MWLGTYNGLFKLDREQDRLVKVKIGTDRIYCINFMDNTLLLATLNGLVLYDIRANTTTRYFPYAGEGINVISTIFQDSKGRIWLGSKKKGLVRFDLKSKQISESYSTENRKLSNDEIREIKEDQKGNLLIATYDGLNVLDTQTGHVSVYNQNSKEAGSLSDYSVESICCDNAGTIWVGTYNGGINYHHKQSGRFRFYRHKKGTVQ